MPQSRRSRRLTIIGTVLAVLLGAFFLAVPLLSGLVAKLVPASVEATVGKQMIDDLAENTMFCRDDAGLAALDSMVDRLAEQTDGTYEYRVYVADQDVLNAFATPGGHIVIYRATIEQAESADEVAGVLAHEMAHIREAHPARAMVESLGYRVFGLLSMNDDNLGAEMLSSAITSHYSREDELAADRTGVEMLNGAGIDSRGLNAFFDRISDSESTVPGALEFMSTHPPGVERKAALEQLTAEGEPALDGHDWEALKSVCDVTGEALYVGN